MRTLSVVQKLALSVLSIGATTLALASSTLAVSLTNGSLTVDINDGNGAIGSASFLGVEYYQEGTFVSNFGFQNGTDTDTFVSNDAFGSAPQPVTVTPGTGFVSVSGNYTGGGANISFSRVYSLVPGLNVLRTVTTFANGGTDATLSLFDTFDPDQGIDRGTGFATFNDVFSLATGAGTARVGQATESSGYSVVIGSINPEAIVASGGPFGIFGGSDLNQFLGFPVDGNGAFADQGTHIGLSQFIASGGTFTFAFDQAFDTTAEGARDAFVAANGGGTAIPTPAMLPGLIGMGIAALRKRRGEAAQENSKA